MQNQIKSDTQGKSLKNLTIYLRVIQRYTAIHTTSRQSIACSIN